MEIIILLVLVALGVAVYLGRKKPEEAGSVDTWQPPPEIKAEIAALAAEPTPAVVEAAPVKKTAAKKAPAKKVAVVKKPAAKKPAAKKTTKTVKKPAAKK